MSPTLAEIILPHLDDDCLAEKMEAFYVEVDKAIAANKPVCRNRGECCRFAAFGHRLYVSSIELTWFVRHSREAWRQPGGASDCPYQINGLCTARSFRPLGCRIFFCDPDSQDWQGPEYERRLIELRGLGTELGIDYRYLEWLSALRELTPAILRKNADLGGIDANPWDMID